MLGRKEWRTEDGFCAYFLAFLPSPFFFVFDMRSVWNKQLFWMRVAAQVVAVSLTSRSFFCRIQRSSSVQEQEVSTVCFSFGAKPFPWCRQHDVPLGQPGKTADASYCRLEGLQQVLPAHPYGGIL